MRFEHIRLLDAELEALHVSGYLQLGLVGGELLHSVVPVGKA